MYRTLNKIRIRLGQQTFMDVSHSISINGVQNIKNRQCNPKMNTQFDYDWYQRISWESEKQFGCVIPMSPSVLSAQAKRDIEICQNPILGYKAMRYFLKNYHVAESDELVPCSTFHFHLGIPDVDEANNEKNKAYLKLYLNADVPIKTTILYYGFMELTTEIGGFVGMILGISLIDIAKSLSSINTVINDRKNSCGPFQQSSLPEIGLLSLDMPSCRIFQIIDYLNYSNTDHIF